MQGGLSGQTTQALSCQMASIVLMGGSGRNDVWRSTNYGGNVDPDDCKTQGGSGRWDHTSVVLPDGSIVLMGGTSYNDVWRSTNYGATWTQMTANAEWSARYGHTSVVIPDGNIVLLGGNGYNDVWRLTTAGSSVQNLSHTYTAAGKLPGLHSRQITVAGIIVRRKTGYISVSAPPISDFAVNRTAGFYPS